MTHHTLTVTNTQDVRDGPWSSSAFNDIAFRERLRHVRRTTFPVGSLGLDDLVALGEIELTERLPTGVAVLLRAEERVLVSLFVGRGNGDIAVAGADRDDVDRVTASIIGALRAEPEDHSTDVPVAFWAQAGRAALGPRRSISAPAWRDIAGNYPATTATALGSLMAAREPGPGGLVLWHGKPGTGKSHALRALLREWHGWCDAHFITDPDVFLGTNADYLLTTLLRTTGRRGQLIILEDAGELLAADARALAGQGLSRLLNVSDGLLGAGLGAVVLVTTNEPLRRLHPAVVRPGRCWAQVEFERMDAVTADAWLAARGSAARLGRPATLAELFAVAEGRAAPSPRSPPIGFAATRGTDRMEAHA